MRQIDWSKAPEGATHMVSGFIDEWRKNHGCNWSAWYEGKWWPIIDPTPDMYIQRPASEPWSGKGLPPVGTVCEFKSGYGAVPTYKVCEVIAHFDGETKPCAAYVYTQHDGTRLVGQGTEQAFRPVPTPEQISAEKQEQEISELARDFYIVGFRSYRLTAEDLHRLGYRKTEGGAA